MMLLTTIVLLALCVAGSHGSGGTGGAKPKYRPLVSGPYGVPDKDITASSEHYWHDYFSPHGSSQSRIHNTGSSGVTGYGGWCPATKTTGDWLQVKFASRVTVVKVLTKGRHDSNYGNYWVTKYKISTSEDCVTFKDYKENGKVKEFAGNKDRGTSVINTLRTPVEARCFRLTVLGYYAHPCMRFEVIGNPACPLGFSACKNSCYKFFHAKFSWSDAAGFCRLQGGNLVSVGNQEENDWIQDGLLGKSSHYITGVNKECRGASIGHFTGLTLKRCLDYCVKIPLCKGVVIKKSTLECWWKLTCDNENMKTAFGKTTYLLVSRISDLWINLNQVGGHGQWVTSPAVPSQYFIWAPQQQSTGNCAAMSPANGYKWVKKTCSSRNFFICEIQLE